MVGEEVERGADRRSLECRYGTRAVPALACREASLGRLQICACRGAREVPEARLTCVLIALQATIGLHMRVPRARVVVLRHDRHAMRHANSTSRASPGENAK